MDGNRGVLRVAGPLPAELGRRYLLGFDTAELPEHHTDVLVIGSGIAGLVAALEASRTFSVALVTKATSPKRAPGTHRGIAGVVARPTRSSFTSPTRSSSAGSVRRGRAGGRGDAPQRSPGCRNSASASTSNRREVALAREGGHSLPRVLHRVMRSARPQDA
jgi:L-aspartate oxidase